MEGKFTSSLRSEIFRPFVTLIVPGTFAIFPYIIVFLHLYPKLPVLILKHEGFSIILFLIAVIAAGILLEDLGSIVESYIYDKLLSFELPERGCFFSDIWNLGKIKWKKEPLSDSDHVKNWYKYLELAFKIEPVGHRYLRTRLLMLKFEISFGFACIFFWFGLVWLDYLYILKLPTPMRFWHISVLLLSITFYMFWEGYNSAVVLSRTRKQVLEAEDARHCNTPEKPENSAKEI